MQRTPCLIFVEMLAPFFLKEGMHRLSPAAGFAHFFSVRPHHFLAVMVLTFVALCNFAFVVAICCFALVCVFHKQAVTCASFCSAARRSVSEKLGIWKQSDRTDGTLFLSECLCSRWDGIAASWTGALFSTMARKVGRSTSQYEDDNGAANADCKIHCPDGQLREGTPSWTSSREQGQVTQVCPLLLLLILVHLFPPFFLFLCLMKGLFIRALE